MQLLNKAFCTPFGDWNSRSLSRSSISFLEKHSVHRLVIETKSLDVCNAAIQQKHSVHRLVIETIDTYSILQHLKSKAFCTPFGDWNVINSFERVGEMKAFCTPFGDWNVFVNSHARSVSSKHSVHRLVIETIFIMFATVTLTKAFCTPFGDWNHVLQEYCLRSW